MSHEVRAALRDGRPVVALETTILAHGLPRPDNLEVGLALEATVRDAGAVPATIAILEGRVTVGLEQDQLAAIAERSDVEKCSSRDLARAIAEGKFGATTVASTIALAARAGISVMATGGIGGVHRGGEVTGDVSADLPELARTRTVVVSAGAKIILDLPRTLEMLETLGVPVLGFETDHFPAFYAADSGLSVPRIDQLDRLAAVCRAHLDFGSGGALVVQPPPSAHALSRDQAEALVDQALAAAEDAGIQGADATPFLLQHMASASDGATVILNRELVLANANLAARLAVAMNA
ncbi:MAG: pseudouridine-5'-phosphate glycosidase [Geminicoccaceae bacterium]